MSGFRGFGQGALAAGGPVPMYVKVNQYCLGYLKGFGDSSVESTVGNKTP